MEWFVPIVVAVITGPIVVILQQLRKENTAQHAESRGLLEHVVVKLDKLTNKVETHIAQPHTQPRKKKAS